MSKNHLQQLTGEITIKHKVTGEQLVIKQIDGKFKVHSIDALNGWPYSYLSIEFAIKACNEHLNRHADKA